MGGRLQAFVGWLGTGRGDPDVPGTDRRHPRGHHPGRRRPHQPVGQGRGRPPGATMPGRPWAMGADTAPGTTMAGA